MKNRLTKANPTIIAVGLLLFAAASVWAGCGFYDLVSVGKCGPDSPARCNSCVGVTCPDDWSCTGGSTYLMCDSSQTYTATCQKTIGFPYHYMIIFCGCIGNTPAGNVPGSTCHQGDTLDCGS